MSAGNKRFSPTEYAMKMEQADEKLIVKADREKRSIEQQFEQLADEVRNYLSSPRGLSDNERRRYSETLNKAVLGFPEEREAVMAIIAARLLQLRIHAIVGFDHPYESLAEAVFAEVAGLHILEKILSAKEGLEEIQVIGTKIYEVRNGATHQSTYQFANISELERIQQNLVLYNNDRINPHKRWAEVRLSDGSRVTMTGFGFTALPTLTIRFYTVNWFSLIHLCSPEYRTIEPKMVNMLKDMLHSRFNLVIIGPTNSGKTHLMKALISELPSNERIVTIEGRREMMLGRDFPEKNIVEYEAEEDDGTHDAKQAFKLALRQSPQRIIHAEIRDDDANIYVRACTRGHRGSMTTIHANSLEDVPEAITDMCMQDGRAMNAERLAKRITEYVTEIGIEIRNVLGRRIVVRIGQFYWQNGKTAIHTLVEYDYKQDVWKYSDRADWFMKERVQQAKVEAKYV